MEGTADRKTQTLANLSAAEAAAALRDGRIASEELVAACLERIAEREPEVQAWAFLDPEHALAQARARDEARREGRPLGPLHGLPVGIKDIFDTADMPTEDGTVLHAGRRPREDATAVALLRAAGAVILGKTVTTELAVYAPGKTRNPLDPRRTPGGSSSGSAAAVAAGMVPLALGTQTNGSMIRPASFCGVYGFKPTYGSISRVGVLRQSPPLDQVGIYARTVEDLALAAEPLMNFDPGDPAMRPAARPVLRATAMENWPIKPRFGFVRTPVWEEAETDTRDAFAELVDFLGDAVREVELPPIFGEAVGWHREIMEADIAKHYAAEYERGRERLSAQLVEIIERGQRVLAVGYNRALDGAALLYRLLEEEFFAFDALITPAAKGQAPLGLGSTGNPIFCTLWTLTGVPALTLPLLHGADGMPIGVQMVVARGDDGRLLRHARWLVEALAMDTA
jgi:Asp-tRNA(Asn)/Glu-tRNA(Gln) amidotransferase A subunit family amidase